MNFSYSYSVPDRYKQALACMTAREDALKILKSGGFSEDKDYVEGIGSTMGPSNFSIPEGSYIQLHQTHGNTINVSYSSSDNKHNSTSALR